MKSLLKQMHLKNPTKTFFGLKSAGTDLKTEIIGGVTTFLTMAYIIFVNPLILGDAGMDKAALVSATCLAAAFGTILLALWSNMPIAMAPGMGLNAFFTYTLVLGRGMAWETALGVVFLSGVLFLLLTVSGIREKFITAIPKELRIATAAGIGLFISFIGLKNLGLVKADSQTIVALGSLDATVFIGLMALLLMVVLEARRIRGSILLGIVFATLLAALFGKISLPDRLISAPPSLAPIAFHLDILSALRWGWMGAIFSFMFIDLFDSIGSIMACCYQGGYVKEDGSIPKVERLLAADAVATVGGALLGTSTTTAYIESASGISEGARTGLASLVTGILFLLAPIFAPLIAVVPGFATAPALILVGAMMFRIVREIDFSKLQFAIPAFLTMILMSLTFSISIGLTFGFLSHILISICVGKGKEISWIMWATGILSVVNLLSL